LIKRVPVNTVAIAEKIPRRRIVRERADELLRGPGGGGMLGDVEWTRRRRWWASTTRTKRTRSRAVGTVKKSIETKS